jgi:hypothetical protein
MDPPADPGPGPPVCSGAHGTPNCPCCRNRFAQSEKKSSIQRKLRLRVQEKKANGIPGLVSGLRSEHEADVLDASRQLRRMLCDQDLSELTGLIEHVVRDARLLPRIVALLHRDDWPAVQVEAAWALTNLVASNKAHAIQFTKAVVNCGAIAPLARLVGLRHRSLEVKDQALWCLANIAGESTKYRDLVLQIINPELSELVPLVRRKPTPLGFLKTLVWACSNLCKASPEWPPPPFELLQPVLLMLRYFFAVSDSDVLCDSCWTLFYLTKEVAHVKPTLDALGGRAARRIVELVAHPSLRVRVAALEALCNVFIAPRSVNRIVVDFLPEEEAKETAVEAAEDAEAAEAEAAERLRRSDPTAQGGAEAAPAAAVPSIAAPASAPTTTGACAASDSSGADRLLANLLEVLCAERSIHRDLTSAAMIAGNFAADDRDAARSVVLSGVAPQLLRCLMQHASAQREGGKKLLIEVTHAVFTILDVSGAWPAAEDSVSDTYTCDDGTEIGGNCAVGAPSGRAGITAEEAATVRGITASLRAMLLMSVRAVAHVMRAAFLSMAEAGGGAAGTEGGVGARESTSCGNENLSEEDVLLVHVCLECLCKCANLAVPRPAWETTGCSRKEVEGESKFRTLVAASFSKELESGNLARSLSALPLYMPVRAAAVQAAATTVVHDEHRAAALAMAHGLLLQFDVLQARASEMAPANPGSSAAASHSGEVMPSGHVTPMASANAQAAEAKERAREKAKEKKKRAKASEVGHRLAYHTIACPRRRDRLQPLLSLLTPSLFASTLRCAMLFLWRRRRQSARLSCERSKPPKSCHCARPRRNSRGRLRPKPSRKQTRRQRLLPRSTQDVLRKRRQSKPPRDSAGEKPGSGSSVRPGNRLKRMQS